MTEFSLIRHGVHNTVDHVLVGRSPGVRLNARGRDQARRIADSLCCKHIDAVQSSPQQRARETAQPLAQRLRLSLQTFADIDELDMGAWTGRSFAELNDDPLWNLWNTKRGSVRPPNGESMQQLQRRAVGHLNKTAASMPEGHVVLCSHAEVLRVIVLHALKRPLDEYHGVDIGPASISTLVIGPDGFEIIALNQPAVP